MSIITLYNFSVFIYILFKIRELIYLVRFDLYKYLQNIGRYWKIRIFDIVAIIKIKLNLKVTFISSFM